MSEERKGYAVRQERRFTIEELRAAKAPFLAWVIEMAAPEIAVEVLRHLDEFGGEVALTIEARTPRRTPPVPDERREAHRLLDVLIDATIRSWHNREEDREKNDEPSYLAAWSRLDNEVDRLAFEAGVLREGTEYVAVVARAKPGGLVTLTAQNRHLSAREMRRVGGVKAGGS